MDTHTCTVTAAMAATCCDPFVLSVFTLYLFLCILSHFNVCATTSFDLTLLVLTLFWLPSVCLACVPLSYDLLKQCISLAKPIIG